jgi:hypothetical protein
VVMAWVLPASYEVDQIYSFVVVVTLVFAQSCSFLPGDFVFCCYRCSELGLSDLRVIQFFKSGISLFPAQLQTPDIVNDAPDFTSRRHTAQPGNLGESGFEVVWNCMLSSALEPDVTLHITYLRLSVLRRVEGSVTSLGDYYMSCYLKLVYIPSTPS